MIPAEAVEAAAKAAYEVMPVELFGEDGPVLWEHLSDSILGNSRKHHELDRARAALEAAAPHMQETGKGKGPIVVPVPRSAVTNLYRTRT